MRDTFDRARLWVRPLSDTFIGEYLEAEYGQRSAAASAVITWEGPGVQLFAKVEGSHFTILGMPLLNILDYLWTRRRADVMIYAEVIGDPIAHSKSPLIHGFWLEALGVAAEYRATHVAVEELAAYFDARRDDSDWCGCNITVPHKVTALDHVPDPGGVRDTIGAINTVFRSEGGALIGTNTDAAGFYAPLADFDLEGAPVAVVGAGGAARALLFALARSGVERVTILNRSPLKAIGLLTTFGLKGAAVPLDAPVPPVALLVNASSLGMTGQPPLALDLSPLPEDAVVYDAVYAPLETGLLAAARARGLEMVDGLEMLIGQAALAFELFFGKVPPRERDAELRALLTA